MLRELPIGFQPWGVEAIRRGDKTRTLRVIRPQPYQLCHDVPKRITGYHLGNGLWRFEDPEGRQANDKLRCPYGTPGDHLWVREKHAVECPYGPARECGHPDHFVFWSLCSPQVRESVTARWRPGIHLPKFAAALWLEVEEVRAERVQDITEEGAKAEGMRYGPSTWVGYRSAFRHVWNDINLNPRPVRRKGEVVRFESFPWCMDDFLESKVAERAKLDSILVMDMQGWKHEEPRWRWITAQGYKPLTIYPNPWCWVVKFRPLEEGFDG